MCFRKGCCRSGPSRSSCPDSAACDGGLMKILIQDSCQKHAKTSHSCTMWFFQTRNSKGGTTAIARSQLDMKRSCCVETGCNCMRLQLWPSIPAVTHRRRISHHNDGRSLGVGDCGDRNLAPWRLPRWTLKIAFFCGQVWHHGRQQRITAATGMNAADQDPLRMFTNVCLSSTLHRALCVCMILC